MGRHCWPHCVELLRCGISRQQSSTRPWPCTFRFRLSTQNSWRDRRPYKAKITGARDIVRISGNLTQYLWFWQTTRRRTQIEPNKHGKRSLFFIALLGSICRTPLRPSPTSAPEGDSGAKPPSSTRNQTTLRKKIYKISKSQRSRKSHEINLDVTIWGQARLQNLDAPSPDSSSPSP